MERYKLLTELVTSEDIKYCVEGEGSIADKQFRIKGPFLLSETKNRNGRIYPKSIMEGEVRRFHDEKIKTNRAVGALDHPPTPTVMLKDACHIIEDLFMEGTIGYGVARMLDTPDGRIAKTLMSEGIKLAVSSRGLGSLQNGVVDSNFKLLTIDIVSEPSAQIAFVESIVENKEYIIQDDKIVECAMEQFENSLAKNGQKRLADDLADFISKLRKNL
jgi:hypothetical protein